MDGSLYVSTVNLLFGTNVNQEESFGLIYQGFQLTVRDIWKKEKAQIYRKPLTDDITAIELKPHYANLPRYFHYL